MHAHVIITKEVCGKGHSALAQTSRDPILNIHLQLGGDPRRSGKSQKGTMEDEDAVQAVPGTIANSDIWRPVILETPME